VVRFPFSVAVSVPTEEAAELVTAWATVAVPDPFSVAVGVLLPPVVLETVIVALLEPELEGVKVTSKVAVPLVAAIVVAERLLTTNWASLEETEIPSACTGPVLLIVYCLVDAAVPTQEAPWAVEPEIARAGPAPALIVNV
jgi:hypothetical protein